jgi:hypothetical protein
MALSRSMKNLMHDAAMARRGPSNPGRPGPEAPSGPIRRSHTRGKAMLGTGGVVKPAVEPPVPGSRLNLDMTTARTAGAKPRPTPGTGGVVGPGRGPRGPVTGGARGPVLRPADPTRNYPGKPQPGRGTFGFVNQGGRGTPALQQATAGARSQMMRQAAARGASPGAMRTPPGADVRNRIGARQGPPARPGGMARAFGSGGSRRRMLR